MKYEDFVNRCRTIFGATTTHERWQLHSILASLTNKIWPRVVHVVDVATCELSGVPLPFIGVQNICKGCRQGREFAVAISPIKTFSWHVNNRNNDILTSGEISILDFR